MRLSTLAALAVFLLAAAPSTLAQPDNDGLPGLLIAETVTSTTRAGTNVDATTNGDAVAMECQSNYAGDVWWTYTPTADGALTMDTSGSDFDTVIDILSQSAIVACDDDSGVGTRSRLENVALVAGTQYFIRVAGFNGQTGDIEFTFEYKTAAAPANDDIADAQVIDGTPDIITGTNLGATRETDVEAGTAEATPSCGGTQYASVWYSFTAPIAGALTVDLAGSSFDTAMSFTSPDGLTEIACNDDAGSAQSRIDDFAVTEGQTILIRVAGFGTGGVTNIGDITLALELDADPGNDDRADAIALTTSGTSSGQNFGATVEADEPAASCASSNSSVWYTYTVPAAGLVSVSTVGSTFDTVLSLNDSVSLGELACDDDSGANDTSVVTDVPVTAGQVILIRVADFGTTRTHGFVELDFAFAPTVDGETTDAFVDALGTMPNPMRGSGRVALSVAEAQTVRVDVMDMRGRRVATLHDGAVAAGTMDFTLDAADLPSGIYVVRAVGETVSLTERLTVVR